MAGNDKSEPKIRECFHCGNRAPMQTVATYNHTLQYGTPPSTDEDHFVWSILLCPSCQKPSLEENFRSTFEMDIDEWPIHRTILYPTPQTTIEDLPENVKKAYEAALKVRNIEPNAFAVLIGRTLEIICKDRNAKGKTLYERLNDLSERNEIPGRLAEMAQGLRSLRNIGAHADLGEVVQSDVPILIDFCEAILEYIYRAPARITILQRRLNSSKDKSSDSSEG